MNEQRQHWVLDPASIPIVDAPQPANTEQVAAKDREIYALHDELAYAHECLDEARDEVTDLRRQLTAAVVAHPERFDADREWDRTHYRPIPWLRSAGPERWSITDRDC